MLIVLTANLLLSLQYPEVYILMTAASVATYIGQLAILALIALFGAASAYMVNKNSLWWISPIGIDSVYHM
jgi:UPF0716 family protein affecting phage T7 exclusion